MGQGRRWTKEEYAYLNDNWGMISISTLSKKLNRSINAITIKVQKLGLGSFLNNGDYVTWNQLLAALGILGGASHKNISWIQNRSFPIRYKRIKQYRFRIVYLNDFWIWAEQNKGFVGNLNQLEMRTSITQVLEFLLDL